MTAIHWRSRVARRAEIAIEERIAVRALVIGHRAGKQSGGGVDNRQRGRLATTQYEITDGDFLGGQMVGDALIDILIMATQESQLSTGGVADGVSLREVTAAWRQQDDWRLRRKRLDRLEEWIGLHDHPRSAAIRVIVDGAMTIVREVSQVDDLVDNAPRRRRLRWNRQRERAGEELGKDRDDAN